MTDQTPVTDDDRRTAYEWCDSPARQATEALAPIIRAIRAHVPAPPATLADELRALDGAPWEMDFSDLADRVEAVEKHNEEVVGIVDDLTEQRDEARAEVERLTAEREVLNTINDHYDRYAVQERAESNAEISAETPNPADVKPGEAWLVECRGERRNAVKDHDDAVPWCTFNADGWFLEEDSSDVTLITRLVPAPRVITNPDDLDRAKRCTVIRDAAGVVRERDVIGDDWSTFTSPVGQKAYIVLPATVLWEPEA